MKLFGKIYLVVLVLTLIAITSITYIESTSLVAETEKLIIDKQRLTGFLVTSEIEQRQTEGQWPFEALKKLEEQEGFLFWWIVNQENIIQLADKPELINTKASEHFKGIASELQKPDDGGSIVIDKSRHDHYGIYSQPFSIGNQRWSFWLGFSIMLLHKSEVEIILSSLVYLFSTLVIFGIVLFVMIRKFLRPLSKLSEGVKTIGGGNLDFHLERFSDDEVGQLATEINQMAVRLKDAALQNKKALEKTRQLADNLNNLPNPALTVDLDFVVTFINKSGAAIAGLSPEECIGRHCYELMSNAHCHTDQCRVGMAMRENGVFQAETVIDPLGRDIKVRYLGAPVHNEDGVIVGALESFIDVTELQQALAVSAQENMMRQGEITLNEKMQGQLRIEELCDRILVVLSQQVNMPIGAIYLLEEKNQEEYLRLASGYAIRKDNKQVDSFALGEGIAGQAAMQQKTLVFAEIPAESIKLAGSSFEAKPLTVLAVPLLYGSKLKGVIELGSFAEFKEEDIGFVERVAGAIAIAVDSAQIREHINDLLMETQRQAEELQAQQEELRTSNEELEEQTRSLQQSEQDLKTQQEELHATNEELEEKTESLMIQKKEIEKKNKDLEIYSRQIKQKAQELAQASKYKSEFLANMSHELRTPLNSLLLLARNLANNKAGNLTETQVKSSETIYSSGVDLLMLINDILDLSKIEAGRIDLNLAEINLQNFAEWIERNFSHLHEEKNLHFSVKVDPQAPEVIRTDLQRLEQIIKNILANALKFTESGEVSVSIGPVGERTGVAEVDISPEDYVAFSIKDTGIGIPAEKQKAIFEAFQQVDGSTSRQYGGTGLGLSISRELAHLLNGSIQLSSALGKGSTFTLIIPAQYKVETVKAAEPEETASAPAISPPRIAVGSSPEKTAKITAGVFDDDRDQLSEDDVVLLIVEDDEKFSRILLDLCREKGFKGVVAGGGEEGLLYAEKYRPAAIILDIMLPGIDGWQVLDALKNNQQLRHIPVHVISATDRTIDAYKKGVIGYLTKPASPEQLEGALAKLEGIINRECSQLLVVEDDEVLCREIAKLIGNGDVQTTTAGSGREVLELFGKKKFDCIILDLGLPDMTGFELLDQMKAINADEVPPIIIYTGKDLTKEEELFVRRYTDAVIVKGVKSAERLLDETALFLHRAVAKMDRKKRTMISNLYEHDEAFHDKNIMVVDDDMRTSFAMCQILEEKGMNVLIADNGQRALEILASEQKIDLIIMDIMMPGIDGYETTRMIRAQDAYWNLPIIALTAKAMPEDKAKCIEAGASDYLAKPVEEGRLLSMMRIWLYR